MFEPYTDWAIIAVFVVIYGLIAGRLGRTWISDAMIFLNWIITWSIWNGNSAISCYLRKSQNYC
jgi:hypothetical protein